MTDILLKQPAPEDAGGVFAAVRESLPELGRFMPWCTPEYALADAERWVAAQIVGRNAGTELEFVIVEAGDERVLGCCGLNLIRPEIRTANLGYWVRSGATGRGVATRAARLAAEWAFRHTTLERLEIVVATDNPASAAVAAKIGALEEGVLRRRLWLHGEPRDARLFALLRPGREGGTP